MARPTLLSDSALHRNCVSVFRSSRPRQSNQCHDAPPVCISVSLSLYACTCAHSRVRTLVACMYVAYTCRHAGTTVSMLVRAHRRQQRQRQRLARWFGGLGSIGYSYGNVSNYRTELLAGAEDPVGQPVSVRCQRGKGEAYPNLPRALVCW